MRKEFERLPEIRKIMNENGIYFMNHSGWYEARDFKDFEYEQYINGAWYAWQAAKSKAVPEGFVLVSKNELKMELRSIRDLNNGEHSNSIIEDCVCNIEAMIEAQEQNQ